MLFDSSRYQKDMMHFFNDDYAYLTELIHDYRPDYHWQHFFWGASRRAVKRLLKGDHSYSARLIRQQLHQTDRSHWNFMRSMY